MIKITIYLTIVLTVAGCTPIARYRSGASMPLETAPTKPSKPAPSDKPSTQYTTHDYVRLGLIIRDYIGRPYKGKSQHDPGLDCSRLTREVFRTFNKTELPWSSANQFKVGAPVHREELFYGDLVFFDTEGGVSHVGIYVGDGEFVHSTVSNGVMISHLSDRYWGSRYLGARRILQ